MSERKLPIGPHRAAIVIAAMAMSALAGTAPASACTPIAPQVELCPSGVEFGGRTLQTFDDGVSWEGEDFWLDFSRELTGRLQALSSGDGAAALDALIAVALSEGHAGAPEQVFRDRFVTDTARVERAVFRLARGNDVMMSAVMVSAFVDTGSQLAWSAGSSRDVAIDELLVLIQTVAGGMRAVGGN